MSEWDDIKAEFGEEFGEAPAAKPGKGGADKAAPAPQQRKPDFFDSAVSAAGRGFEEVDKGLGSLEPADLGRAAFRMSAYANPLTMGHGPLAPNVLEDMVLWGAGHLGKREEAAKLLGIDPSGPSTQESLIGTGKEMIQGAGQLVGDVVKNPGEWASGEAPRRLAGAAVGGTIGDIASLANPKRIGGMSREAPGKQLMAALTAAPVAGGVARGARGASMRNIARSADDLAVAESPAGGGELARQQALIEAMGDDIARLADEVPPPQVPAGDIQGARNALLQQKIDAMAADTAARSRAVEANKGAMDIMKAGRAAGLDAADVWIHGMRPQARPPRNLRPSEVPEGYRGPEVDLPPPPVDDIPTGVVDSGRWQSQATGVVDPGRWQAAPPAPVTGVQHTARYAPPGEFTGRGLGIPDPVTGVQKTSLYSPPRSSPAPVAGLEPVTETMLPRPAPDLPPPPMAAPAAAEKYIPPWLDPKQVELPPTMTGMGPMPMGRAASTAPPRSISSIDDALRQLEAQEAGVQAPTRPGLEDAYRGVDDLMAAERELAILKQQQQAVPAADPLGAMQQLVPGPIRSAASRAVGLAGPKAMIGRAVVKGMLKNPQGFERAMSRVMELGHPIDAVGPAAAQALAGLAEQDPRVAQVLREEGIAQ